MTRIQKRLFTLSLLLVLAVVVKADGEDEEGVPSVLPVRLELTYDKDISEQQAERIKQRTEKVLGFPTVTSRRRVTKTNDETVVLTCNVVMKHEILLDEKAIIWKFPFSCTVNVTEISDDGLFNFESKVHLQRIEREVIRAIGGLLGLSECPMWTCVLSQHRNVKELDRKGRGLCPPCMIRLEKRKRILKPLNMRALRGKDTTQ